MWCAVLAWNMTLHVYSGPGLTDCCLTESAIPARQYYRRLHLQPLWYGRMRDAHWSLTLSVSQCAACLRLCDLHLLLLAVNRIKVHKFVSSEGYVSLFSFVLVHSLTVNSYKIRHINCYTWECVVGAESLIRPLWSLQWTSPISAGGEIFVKMPYWI